MVLMPGIERGTGTDTQPELIRYMTQVMRNRQSYTMIGHTQQGGSTEPWDLTFLGQRQGGALGS